MRPAVTLYEFMPYGAPELLESRQRHMSRALVVASATAIALWALARAVVPLIHATPPEEHSVIIEPGPFVIPPPLVPPAPAPAAPYTPVARPPAPDALPVPVPDPVAPPIEAPAMPTGGTDTAPPGATGSSDTGAPPSSEARLPGPREFVYVEELPSVVKEVKPPYPSLAMQAGIEGLVLVKVLVGTDGRVRDVLLDEKVHVPMLDEAALTAARRWVFTPGLAQGRPVACWTAIPFRFRLH